MPEERSLICVVEDDPSMRKALKRLISTLDYAVEIYATAGEFLSSDGAERADCILLDVNLPDLDGLSIQHHLNERGSRTPIVFLTGRGDVPMSVEAMRAGAVDFLLKPFNESDLIRALSQAVSVSLTEAEKNEKIAEARSRIASLTAREADVLGCVLTGAMNKQIAHHLGIAEKTVKVHRGRLMEKMKAKTVVDLVAQADLADFAADADLAR